MQRQINDQDISSSRTHHILQSSTTLNRRYVHRPTKIVSYSKNTQAVVSSRSPYPRPIAQTSQVSNTLDEHMVNINFKSKSSQNHLRQADSLKTTIKKSKITIPIFKDEENTKNKSTSLVSSPAPAPSSVSTRITRSLPTSSRNIKNPYLTSALIRKTAEKIQQNPSGFSPIFDQQTKMNQAFLLVSEQEKLSLEQSAKPTAIFTKSSKKSGHFFKLKNKTNSQVPKNTQQPHRISEAITKTNAPRILHAQKTVRKIQSAPVIPATNMTINSVDSAFSKIKNETAKKDQSVVRSQFSPKSQQISHKKGARFIFAFCCSAAVVAALFFIIQSNMPDLSVRVAAIQTGIQASYPSYIPREYRLLGVYTTQDNSVAMDFVGPNQAKFTLSEEKLPWDSNTLLNRFVKAKWGEKYDSIREQGITIYVNNSNAAWVNAGIVYKIINQQGELTKKQIKNIVTSL